MTDDVYIFGTSPLACIFAGYLKLDKRYRFMGYVLNSQYCKERSIYGDPLNKYEQIVNGRGHFLNCIGYSKMLTIRRKIDEQILSDGGTLLSYIHPAAKIMDRVEFGKGSLVMADAYLGQYCRLGKSNIVWAGAHLEHNVIAGDYNFFAAQSCLLGGVKVSEHCFCGGNSTVRDNVMLAPYTLVGAGAYIGRNTNENGVYTPTQTVKLAKNSLEVQNIPNIIDSIDDYIANHA
jgi:carbonic anhydrase/acetyltransferase-like protein (isoleucine patch superfamily)